MEYISTASVVPAVALVLFAQQNGPELIRDFPAAIRNQTFGAYDAITDFLLLIWQDPNLFFLSILILRYYRLIGHVFAYYLLYKPDETPAEPTFTAWNAHVVVPTVDPGNVAFEACLTSILRHSPRWLTVVAGGEEHVATAQEVVDRLRHRAIATEVEVIHTDIANKRRQMSMVLEGLAEQPEVNKDTIVVFVDDHAWWTGEDFLDHLLAPFENEKVGLVGIKKRAQRDRGYSLIDSAINFIACIYLERHNFELTAQNALDGGAFIVSARTCAVRASIIMESEFRDHFTNEKFFFNRFGPLNSDDDNYITRYVYKQGWKVKFQNDDDATTMMYTTLGIDGYWKLHGQLLRWARSQWRSNACSLFTDRTIWKTQWWTTHAGHITSFINLAIVWDPLIVYTWHRSTLRANVPWWYILILVFGSKMVKLLDHFSREPRDLLWFPVYVIFAYYHSFFKIWTLFTFWDCTWAGRKLRTEDPIESSDDDGSDDENPYEDNQGGRESVGLNAWSPGPFNIERENAMGPDIAKPERSPPTQRTRNDDTHDARDGQQPVRSTGYSNDISDFKGPGTSVSGFGFGRPEFPSTQNTSNATTQDNATPSPDISQPIGSERRRKSPSTVSQTGSPGLGKRDADTEFLAPKTERKPGYRPPYVSSWPEHGTECIDSSPASPYVSPLRFFFPEGSPVPTKTDAQAHNKEGHHTKTTPLKRATSPQSARRAELPQRKFQSAETKLSKSGSQTSVAGKKRRPDGDIKDWDTQWGGVSTSLPYSIPANAREAQLSGKSQNNKAFPIPQQNLSRKRATASSQIEPKPRLPIPHTPPPTKSEHQVSWAPPPAPRFHDRYSASNSPGSRRYNLRETSRSSESPPRPACLDIEDRGRIRTTVDPPLATPPLQPFPSDLSRGRSQHTHDPRESCIIDREDKTPPRTNLYVPMPAAPKKEIKIHAGPVRVSRNTYHRDFIRGDDCHKLHADGTYLSVERLRGKKRCRSPQPKLPVIGERPRL